MAKLAVNQVLWFAGNGNFDHRRGEVTVTAVGRKWAEVSGVIDGKLNMETMKLDRGGFSSPGRCYHSKADWLATDGTDLVWRKLRQAMPIVRPEGVSYNSVAEAAKLLGISLSELN